ncbi:hypothetical protein CFP56_011591 [Quercus suber]|uniref:Uncharacterized protein n=1 Tax=Quercus suber TaxID=58331 RepID=A0AAW0L1G4_QUESU
MSCSFARLALDTHYSSCSTKICSAARRSQMWVIHSGELAKLMLEAILRSHLCEKDFTTIDIMNMKYRDF